MSKVIKKSVELDDAVTIKISDRNSTALAPNDTKGTRASLNFRRGIDSAIDICCGRVKEHVSGLEDDRKHEMEESSRAAYDRGYTEGKEAEFVERDAYVNEHFSSSFRVIDTLVKETKKSKENASRGLEKKLIALAIAIAEKIIHKSIATDTSIIETIVAETIAHVISGETLILKVSAADFKHINSQYDKWLEQTGNVGEFRIEIDKRMTSGNCLIETEGGIIDGILSHRLDEIAEELLKVNG